MKIFRLTRTVILVVSIANILLPLSILSSFVGIIFPYPETTRMDNFISFLVCLYIFKYTYRFQLNVIDPYFDRMFGEPF